MKIMDIRTVWLLQFSIQGLGFQEIIQKKLWKTFVKSEESLPETGEKRPNILFLQLESFFDPELVEYLNISEDPNS